ncbi:unnamed protein product [Discosporangium mesarthrocarpum]
MLWKTPEGWTFLFPNLEIISGLSLQLSGITRLGSNLRSRGAPLRKLSVEAVETGGSTTQEFDIFNPTEEHRQLRDMVRSFVEKEVDPQALEYNRDEKFNMDLFRRLGELGMLGITVSADYGGSGMDAAAACIVHEELSAADPAFCLSYLGEKLGLGLGLRFGRSMGAWGVTNINWPGLSEAHRVRVILVFSPKLADIYYLFICMYTTVWQTTFFVILACITGKG